MKKKKEIIGIFLIGVVMVSLGLAFNPEEDLGYLPFLVVMAFVTLMFLLVKISQSNVKKQYKTIYLFTSAASGITVERSLYSLEVWGQSRGLYERAGTV